MTFPHIEWVVAQQNKLHPQLCGHFCNDTGFCVLRALGGGEEPVHTNSIFPSSLVHMQPVMSHVCQTNIWWCNFKHKTCWPIKNPNIKWVIIQWWKSFWTPHAIVIYWSPQVHFILVQQGTFTHMLHIKCSIQLKTGCFSQTTSLSTHPECKNYKCTRI